jgi:hypothetical protein
VQGWGAQDTVLISRKPFSAGDRDLARRAIARAKMQTVYIPGEAPQSPFADLLLTGDAERFYSTYSYDVRPVSDDRPFFFYTVQPRDLWNFLTGGRKDSADYKINRAVPLLFGLVAISVAATIVVLALPPVLLGARLPSSPGERRSLLYFLLIGAGYILIEIALIQKFVLFLGHPVYALTVIVFSMLVFSSLGSRASKRAPRYLLPSIAALVALLAFAVPWITSAGPQWPLLAKCAVAATLIAAPAYLMGMPFPAGLRSVRPASVRWAWSVNSASSVLGSAAAIFFAIYLGLRATLLIGALCYLLAMWAGRALKPSPDAAHSPALP